MDFEQALTYELQSIPDLKGKVYPQNAIENAEPPFVVYISSEGEKIMTLSGATNLTELSCEIHVVCETYEQMKGITRAVINRITSFFRRQIGQDGPVIKSVSYIEPVEDTENDLNYHRCSFDMRVRF